ncbi:MAG: hypothetical protein JWM76_4921 [Pseudonocardiales bacterium]|nr:hypothetical protein [Pseudonocardiales bacterium]
MTWPDGPRGRLRLDGRARDVRTGTDGESTEVLADESLEISVSPERTITAIESIPYRDKLSNLIGGPAISGFRRQLATVAADELAAARPLYLLLDDLPGATIVSDFAQRQWLVYEEVLPDGTPAPSRRVVNVCTGFAAGSSALNPDGSSTGSHRTTAVALLPRPDDRAGWHEFEETTVMSMRRARRIDVRVSNPTGDASSGAVLEIDSMFQDSSTAQAGGRTAVHEYSVRVTADAETGVILALSATPGNLPYGECPMAGGNVVRLVGTRLDQLRANVASELKGVAGCTHLNDALRALTEVPVLARYLTRAS